MKPKKLKKMANGNKPPKPHGKPEPPYVPPTWIPIPTGLEATAISSTEIELKWDSVPDAQGYWIYRTKEGGAEEVPAIVQETTFVDGRQFAYPVTPNTSYTYHVAAVVADPNNGYVSTLGGKSESVIVITPS